MKVAILQERARSVFPRSVMTQIKLFSAHRKHALQKK